MAMHADFARGTVGRHNEVIPPEMKAISRELYPASASTDRTGIDWSPFQAGAPLAQFDVPSGLRETIFAACAHASRTRN